MAVTPLDAMKALQTRARALNGDEPEYKDSPTLEVPALTQEQRLWPQPLAPEAYYGITGEVVKEITPHTEADPVAILANWLVSIGNAAGRGPHAIAEADRHGTNLFAVLVGRTSKGRKGSSSGHIRRLCSLIDPAWESTRVMGGMSSGEGLIYHVRDAIEKDESIKEGRNYTGGFERVVIDPGIEDKRLLAYEPEFSSVLKVMSRETNTLSAQVRQAYDSGKLRTMVKNNPTVATDAHISILGHITKDELLRYLADTEYANGFGNRYMWFCVERAQILPEGGGMPNYQHLVQAAHDALERAKAVGFLERDAETRKAWAEIYPDLSEGKPGLFGAITARAEAQVLRLSVLYAALDGADAMKLPHLMAALAVWQYAEDSARYIFGDATGDPVADRIHESLLQFGEMTRTDINSKVFGRHVSAGRISQALALLLKVSKARFEKRETEGRSIEVWRAV